jgi:hypothetical protein
MGKKMNVTTASARGEELWEKRTKGPKRGHVIMFEGPKKGHVIMFAI